MINARESRIACVLFDLDGTLLDSFTSHLSAYVAMFRRFNRTISKSEFLKNYSPNWFRTYEAFGLPKELWGQADKVWLEENARLQPKFFPGTKRALLRLKKSYKVGLVTSGSRDRVMKDLENNKASSLFEVVITGDDVQRKKPDPEGLLKALEFLGINSGQTVYVGDAPEDKEMAERAGVRFTAVQSQFSKNVAGSLKNMRELDSVLKKMSSRTV